MIHNKKTLVSSLFFSGLLLASIVLFSVATCSGSSSDVSSLFINEFMADNGITVAGPNGYSPDWIELYNAGTETIDLTGMYLTDNLNNPTRWQFPEGTTIGPEEYLIVWADADGGDNYAAFGLDANGEEIGLFDSDGVTLIDSVTYVKQIQDVSYGRFPDGGSSWNYLLSATPGSSNQEPAPESESSLWTLVLLVVVFVVAGVVILVNSKLR
ncbi:MAG: hypothetical protein CW716_05765 [Candidatus Bathyarchaeum sp.]|nr:MAG: hypothetical protein CW716_05765 [Candidatus Bathyarchaeum sp.]